MRWVSCLACQPAWYIGNSGYFMKCGGKFLLLVALLLQDSRRINVTLTIPKICSQLM